MIRFARGLTLGLVLASGAGAPALADKIKNPVAVFSGLDKITGRIIAFEVNIDETVQFGSLQLTPRVCYSRPTYENPQTDTFVEVDEVAFNNEYKRLFSGWMFATSPGLNAIEHPVYDIWLTECKGGTDVIKQEAEKEEAPAAVQAPQVARPQRPPQSPPRAQQARKQPQQRFFPTNTGPAGHPLQLTPPTPR